MIPKIKPEMFHRSTLKLSQLPKFPRDIKDEAETTPMSNTMQSQYLKMAAAEKIIAFHLCAIPLRVPYAQL